LRNKKKQENAPGRSLVTLSTKEDIKDQAQAQVLHQVLQVPKVKNKNLKRKKKNLNLQALLQVLPEVVKEKPTNTQAHLHNKSGKKDAIREEMINLVPNKIENADVKDKHLILTKDVNMVMAVDMGMDTDIIKTIPILKIKCGEEKVVKAEETNLN